MITGRFAPSPTGRMHLGNVYSALLSWLSAKQQGGEWILRIEDLDPQRSRMEYALQAEDDLRWLGLMWDKGGTGAASSSPLNDQFVNDQFVNHSASENNSPDAGKPFSTAEALPSRSSSLRERKDVSSASENNSPDAEKPFTNLQIYKFTNLERAFGSFVQSERSAIYAHYLRVLEDMGLTYPCYCTRADIMATQAPHESDGRVVYKGTCRPAKPLSRPSGTLSPERARGESTTAEAENNLPRRAFASDRESEAHKEIYQAEAENNFQIFKFANLQIPEGKRASTRLMVEDRLITFCDAHYGPQSVNLASHCGDFIVRRADGAWAYQLAVVVDDALMGVTEVVRGRDLLLSSAQQIYLYELLGFPVPRFCHLPLLVNEAGQRLSKRDKSLDMGCLRERFAPEELIGILAHAAGQISRPEPISLQDLLPLFSWDKVPTEDVLVKI